MSEKPLTQNRQAVFDVLRNSQEALSAYDILDALHALDNKWKPATVYRAINYLIDENLIHRIESQQKFICCGHKHTSAEKHFLICDNCGDVSEKSIDASMLALFAEISAQNNFQLNSPYLEFRGLCAKCQAA